MSIEILDEGDYFARTGRLFPPGATRPAEPVAFYVNLPQALREMWSVENGYGEQPYPAFDQYPEFKGLFVGGCVERGVGSSFRAAAHAHTDPKDDYQGWLCVRSPKRLRTGSGGPSQLMLHEVAHLLVAHSHGHDDVWRAKARSLGYRLPARYQKRPARRKT